MNLERSKNTKRNIVAGLVNQCVSLLLPFLTRSLMIRKMGVDYLGLNSLFSSILQVLSLAELGFGSAMVYNMYKPIAENDTDTVCALLKAYRDIYRIIGAVILSAGIAVLPFIPKLIQGACPAGMNLYILFLIYLSNAVISYWMFAYKISLLNAFQRADVVSNAATVTKLLLNVLQIMVLFTVRNYYVYVILIPFCTILNNLISAYMADKLFQGYVCKGVLSKEIKDSIRHNVAGLIIGRLCTVSRNSFDSIFITAFMGLTVSAIYSNYYYVILAVIMMISVITGSMLAGVGNSAACYDTRKNYEDMKKFNFLYMWISGWCTVCLVCLVQPFMEFWVGAEYMFDTKTVFLLCIYFYVLKMGDIRAVYSDAVGLWWQNRYRAVAESAANLILNYLFVKRWGVNGIIMATLISLFLINFCLGSQIVYKHYFKNGKIGEYFGLHIFYGLVTLAACLATYYICGLVRIKGLAGLVLKAVICCILPNCLYLAVYYRTKLYVAAVPWILKVMHLESGLKILIPKNSLRDWRKRK